MQKDNQLSYNIDGAKINPYTIQQAYDKAKATNKTSQILENTFQLLELVNRNQQQTDEKYVLEIKNIVADGMMGRVKEQRKGNNLNAWYPLSKQGGLGTLVRDCRIIPQGLEEKEGNGKPKVKQLTGFINKIQKFSSQSKPSLPWIQDSKKYPFRIIVEGTKKEKKGIYFEDKESAEQIRMSLINKFLYKGGIKKFTQQLKQRHQQRIISSFKSQIAAYNEHKKKMTIPSDKKDKNQPNNRTSFLQNNEAPSSASIAQYSVQDISPPIMNRGSTTKSQQGYDRTMMDMLIDREDKISTRTKTQSKFNFGTILKMQRIYKLNFFYRWLQLSQSHYEKSLQKETSRINKIKQKSQIDSKYQSDRKSKASVIKSAMRSSPSKHSRRPSTLSFPHIEFLKETNILIKPIISISVFKFDCLESESIYNTSLRSKDPHLSYDMMVKVGRNEVIIDGDVRDYEIHIKAIDYLSNYLLCDDRISLKTKVLSEYSLVTNDTKEFRMQIRYDSNQNRKDDESRVDRADENPDGNVLEIAHLQQKYINQIHQYWAEEASRRGIFQHKEIKIFEILQRIDNFPVSWVAGMPEHEQKIIYILQSASKILNFVLLPSLLPLMRTLQKFYSEADQLVQAILSLLTNYLQSYYFPSHHTKIQKLHRDLGLEGQIQFSSKVSLQMSIISKIVEIQCRQLTLSLNRKNIAFTQLLYQCIYEFYANCFPVKTLSEIWNFCFQNSEMIQTYAILIGVWLMKFYQKKLIRCNNYKEMEKVLMSHQTCPSENIIKGLIILREKYFSQSKSQKQKRFDNTILDNVIIDFYRRQTKKIDFRKENRIAEKDVILKKLNKEIQTINLPKYQQKQYCLHLYFYQLPNVPGSLYIKANGIQYECRNYMRDRYIIIDSVNTEMYLQFVNNKSDEFVGQIICLQGVGKYEVELKSEKNKEIYKISYLCGLVTEPNMENIKKNRRFEHLLGSSVKQEQILKSFIKNTEQSIFLNTTASKLEKDDLGKKIKVIFSSGNKDFDEVDFYLRWIASSGLTLSEKCQLVKMYTRNLCQQFFLCTNEQLQKVFLFSLLQIMEFPISQNEFQCFYSNCLLSEIQSAKIFKCVFVFPNGTEFPVQQAAYKYYGQKCQNFVYGDLQIKQLLEVIQQQLQNQLANISQGTLRILLSQNGTLRNIQLPIIRKKTNKQLVVDQTKYEQSLHQYNIGEIDPKILSNDILTGMQKTKSILNFIEGSKGVDSLPRIPSPNKRIVDNLNILQTCHEKLRNTIILRYNSHPNKIDIPFLHYFHEIMYKTKTPYVAKNLFLNNKRTDLRKILCSEYKLNFSDNKRTQPKLFNVEGDFYQNFRNVDVKNDTIIFETMLEQEDQQIKKIPNAFVFFYYGFSIYRWEPCIAKGFIEQYGENSKRKRYYLIQRRNAQSYVKQSQIQIDSQVAEELPKLDKKTVMGSIKKSNKSSKVEVNSRLVEHMKV